MSSPRETPQDGRRDLILYRRLKAMLKGGTELSSVQRAIREYCENAGTELADFRADLRRAATLFRNEPTAVQKAVYPLLLEGSGPFSSEKLAVRSRRLGLALEQVPSFTVCMNNRMYQKREGQELLPEMRLAGSKAEGHRFARAHGVRVPERFQDAVPAVDLRLLPGTVVKPANAEGSRGVYVILSEGEVRRVKDQTRIGGAEQLRGALAEDLSEGAVALDEWTVEELITGDAEGRVPGRDYKFYSFYGSIPLILEVTRWPQVGYCWWNPDGTRAETGKYQELGFDGAGVPDDVLQEAQKLSHAIPAPFIRIDFIASSGAPVLGEFESHPGDYERFSPELDALLGREYLDAETRIVRDMLAGRTFPFFSAG